MQYSMFNHLCSTPGMLLPPVPTSGNISYSDLHVILNQHVLFIGQWIYKVTLMSCQQLERGLTL